MSESTYPKAIHPIDVVITWVNGNDIGFQKKVHNTLGGQCSSTVPGAHHTRFATINEIKYCVLSIFTFAPFVRNIFIVTSEQDPNLYDDIKTHFPERVASIKIVDHKEVFRGYESYLPTFNSRSIESMLWRIDGLSDNFVYFNDDVFLIRSISPDDWFVNGQPILRGRWLFKPVLRLIWDFLIKAVHKYLLGNNDFQTRPSYHIGQWLSASLLGFKFKYFFFSHTPFAVNRKRVEEFFLKNDSLFEKNISYRFKNQNQFNFVALATHLEIIAGNKQFANPNLAYLQPLNRSKNYIDRKIKLCERNTNIKFLCAQSLEMCTTQDQNKLFSWMDKVLSL
jgi:hypothetical protein